MARPLETTTTQATPSTTAAAAIAAVSPGRQNGKRTDDDIRHRRQVGHARNFINEQPLFEYWKLAELKNLARSECLENFCNFMLKYRNTEMHFQNKLCESYSSKYKL
jgi:hypothetical protein